MTDVLNTDVTLQIGDQQYTGWKAIGIGTGIEQLAGTFDLVCADRWAINGQPRPILPGKPCTVRLYGVPVITGFIDEASPSYGPNEHSLNIRGRDATGDLVDCAASTDGQSWEGRNLLQIANDVCRPFVIPVKLDGPVGAVFRKQAVSPGETAFEVLSRAARQRGYLLVSDAKGGLLITRTGSRRATRSLRLGVDILSGDATFSHAERFARYDVIGQDNEALNEGSEDLAQQVKASATDPAIRRSRVTVIDVPDATDRGVASQIALWTAANRKARGERAELTVRGWRDGAAPWAANTLVRIDDPWLGLAGEYLIASVAFSLDDQGGQITRLSVTPPSSYTPEPLIEIEAA
ncbi:phage baseplate assembly protein [Nevskia sp.]|uniref:phage baseplate assembly protein n=1 Tax=Nevskia sp. TaxID=1929292 RepID=UPI0025D83279|nr:contractile injection system protein, VgrG/Pvc8 family [Nevskia sp.]